MRNLVQLSMKNVLKRQGTICLFLGLVKMLQLKLYPAGRNYINGQKNVQCPPSLRLPSFLQHLQPFEGGLSLSPWQTSFILQFFKQHFIHLNVFLASLVGRASVFMLSSCMRIKRR